MILHRFYDEQLAQASYLVGCPAAGQALVIDAARDVDQYIAAAAAHGLRVAAVTETHIHADFVSGSRELAARTGAILYLSDEGGPDWRYGYAAEAGALPLRDGDEIGIGGVRVRAFHTPGHTPEHLSFLLTDTAATSRPMGVFTGDFVFVGDVGRPDLLERAAGMAGSADAGARRLFASLQRFKGLPDYLQIWPGHGAGSACGRGLSAVPQSTVGFERIANWAFLVEDEEEFVREVLRDQPEAPRYFAEMKRVNRDGPRFLVELPPPESLPNDRLADLVAQGALLIDVRPSEVFASGHVPGTINIPLGGSFVTWAGSLLPHDRPLYAIGVDPAKVGVMLRHLHSIGLDQIAAYFGSDAVDAWRASGNRVGSVAQIDPSELAGRRDVLLLDVRSPLEWRTGRLPGALHAPLGTLPEQLKGIARDRAVVTYCQSGARSAIAASMLAAAGFPKVANLRGGMDAWRAAGNRMDGSSAALSSAA